MKIKLNCRQVKVSSDRASLISLSPEALQTQYKDYGLLLAMAIPYHRASWLHTA